MRLSAFAPFLLLLFYSVGWCQDYKTFTREGMVGLKSEKGKVLIPAAFEFLGWSDGKFSVSHQVTGYREHGRWGLVSVAGKLVTPAIYDKLIPGAGNAPLIRVQQQNLEGCITPDGATAIPIQYVRVIPDGERVILVSNSAAGNRFGVADLQHRTILPAEWSRIRMVTANLMAVAGPNNRTAFFDKNGIRLTEFDYDSIGNPKGKHIPVLRGSYVGLADFTGKIVRYPSFKSIATTNSGEIQLTRYDRWILLNRENKEVRSIEGDSLLPLAQSLIRVVRGNKQGVVNEQLREVWPMDYDVIRPVEHELILAGKNGKVGLARQDGRFVVPPNYQQFKTIGRSLALATASGERLTWYLYQPSTGTLSQKGYDKIEAIADVFRVTKGRFEGLAAQDGNVLLDCVYEKILDVAGNSIGVQFMGKYGVIDRTGMWLMLPQDEVPVLLSENIFQIGPASRKKIYDRTGRLILETENEIRRKENTAEVWQPNAAAPTQIIQLRNGTLVQPMVKPSEPPADRLASQQNNEPTFSESEGLVGFVDRGKYGFRDLNGRLRIPNRYDSLLPFSSGLAPVKLNGKWGAVDHQDHLVIQPKFEYLSMFREDLAIAKLHGKFGIADRMGFKLDAAYDELIPVMNGKLYIIRSGKHYGLARADGTILLEARFEELRITGNDQVMVKDGLYGVVTITGLSVIPIQFAELRYFEESGFYLARAGGLQELVR